MYFGDLKRLQRFLLLLLVAAVGLGALVGVIVAEIGR